MAARSRELGAGSFKPKRLSSSQLSRLPISGTWPSPRSADRPAPSSLRFWGGAAGGRGWPAPAPSYLLPHADMHSLTDCMDSQQRGPNSGPDPAPGRGSVSRPRDRGRGCRGDPNASGTRSAADWDCCGNGSGDGGGEAGKRGRESGSTRTDPPRVRCAPENQADCREPPMGTRTHAPAGGASSRRRRIIGTRAHCGGERDLGGGSCNVSPDWRARRDAHSDRGHGLHHVQCGRARDRRHRDGAGAGVHAARVWPVAPRGGTRDPTPAAGQQAYGLGADSGRRGLHPDRRRDDREPPPLGRYRLRHRRCRPDRRQRRRRQ